ncbi:MAG: hypothetical protein ACFBSD_15100 [Paracoccaceae bacterium]
MSQPFVQPSASEPFFDRPLQAARALLPLAQLLSSAQASPKNVDADRLAGARLLHDRVRDELRFGWGMHFWDEPPAETWIRGLGYSVTKSAVLVRLLREAGYAARLVFAEVDARLFGGILEPGTPYLDHAYVVIDGPDGPIAFDSHILDRPFFRAAQARLRAQGRTAGWGTHRDGTDVFPGFSQFVPALRGRVWGSFEDARQFYDRTEGAWNRVPWLVRLGFGAVVAGANARVARLRRHG